MAAEELDAAAKAAEEVSAAAANEEAPSAPDSLSAATAKESVPPRPLGSLLIKPPSEVSSDPNFAVVCAFIDRFGGECGVQCPNIGDLQDMIEASSREVRQDWIVFQVKLLRKLKKSVSTDKWERALTKFAHTYSPQDGWELERFGYRNSRPALKVRLIKNLLEAQFDVNPKFKQEINQKTAKDLRSQPLGTDR